MNKRAIQKIKKKLLSEKEEILSKTYDMNVDYDGDETDEIQGNMIESMNIQLSARNVVKLARIEAALKKIESNSYGSCEECEGEISEKRLEFNPYFSTCISCAEELEIMANKKGGRIH